MRITHIATLCPQVPNKHHKLSTACTQTCSFGSHKRRRVFESQRGQIATQRGLRRLHRDGTYNADFDAATFDQDTGLDPRRWRVACFVKNVDGEIWKLRLRDA